MKKIYSALNNISEPELLHIVVRSEDFSENRLDVSPEEEFLQLSVFTMKKGKTFKPHKHINCEKLVTIPQESWVILSGVVKISYYDLDDTIIDEEILNAGDISITYRGGHNYLCLEDNTVVAEYKTPNYTGQADDKVFI